MPPIRFCTQRPLQDIRCITLRIFESSLSLQVPQEAVHEENDK